MGSHFWAVLVLTSPAGPQIINKKMVFSSKALIVVVLICGSEAGRQLRGNHAEVRGERSLLNTFPFNARDAAEDHHHGHHEHHEAPARVPSQDLAPRADRQGSDTDVSFPAVAAAGPGSDGKRCIDKVEMVEETEYDETVQCDHSYDRRCHTTYTTNYESQQEEECEENFRKNCFIDYECWTKQEEHDVEDDVVSCSTVQDEKCDDETSGYTTFTKCSKWPREVCTVEKKAVKKYTPITGCTKEPREVCAPAGCGFSEGEETCYDKTQTIVQDAPKEECSLEPQRTCAHVTKLVPKLEPTEECVDVPKEVC